MPVMNISMKGGVQPTGTKMINSNGIHDVAGYANADVQVPNPSTGTLTITTNGTHNVKNYADAYVNVPTTAPDGYQAYNISSAGYLSKGSFVLDFIRVTRILNKGLSYACYNNTNISGTIGFSNLTRVADYGLQYAFYGCTGITGVTFGSLTYIGASGLDNAFKGCSNLTGTIDLSTVTSLGGNGLFSFISLVHFDHKHIF